MTPKLKKSFPTTTGLYRITAPIAEQLLATEPIRQRIPSRSRIDMYRRDILNDRWSINGETLKLSDTGKMIDGQNRSMAIIRADLAKPGAYIDSWVIVGLDEKAAMMSIDTGKTRTLGDVLRLLEVTYLGNVSSTLRILTAYETHNNLSRANTSVRECIEVYNHYDEVVQTSCQRVWNHFKLYSRGSATFIHIAGTLAKQGEEAEMFLGSLASGIDLAKNSPVLALRELLSRWQRDRAFGHRTLSWRTILPYYIIAYNHYLQGEDAKNITFSPGIEAWPKLHNDPFRDMRPKDDDSDEVPLLRIVA